MDDGLVIQAYQLSHSAYQGSAVPESEVNGVLNNDVDEHDCWFPGIIQNGTD
jgi:hypothetical protein